MKITHEMLAEENFPRIWLPINGEMVEHVVIPLSFYEALLELGREGETHEYIYSGYSK